MGDYSRDEIMEMFKIDEAEVVDLTHRHDKKLNDEDVSEEEYQEWCDQIDEAYGTADIA